MEGGVGGTTVKFTLLLAIPPALTTTFPVVAPVGTGTVMLVSLQLLGVAVVPLNVTVLAPCDEPKLVPAITTEIPTDAEVGLKLDIFGGTVPAAPAGLKAARMLPRDP